MGTTRKTKIIFILFLLLMTFTKACSDDDNYKLPYSLNRDSNYIKEKLYVYNVASKMLKMYYINFGDVFEGRDSDIVEIVVDTLLIKGNKLIAFPVIVTKNKDYYNPYAPQDFLEESSHYIFRLCPLIGYRDSINGLWKLFPFPQITTYGTGVGVRGIRKDAIDFLDSEEYTNNGKSRYINDIEQKYITPYKYKLSDPLFWTDQNIIWQKGFMKSGYYMFELDHRDVLELVYPDSSFIYWYLNHKFTVIRER